MTHRPTVSFLLAVLLAGRLIGCASGALEGGPVATNGSPPVAEDEAAPAADSVVGVGWVDAMVDAGEFGAAAEALLGLPAGSVTATVMEQLGVAVRGLPRHDLESLAEVAADLVDDPRIGPVFAELALRHAAVGDTEPASAAARRVVAVGVAGESLRLAQAVLRGDLSGLLPRSPIVGAVLPQSGSPTSREYARLLLEGMEVAVTLARRGGLGAELLVEDNQGTRSGSVRGASRLVSRGAVAIIGPLSDENLEAAVGAAPSGVPLLSPTARRLPAGRRGVYSMGVGDPGAGRTLAEAVARLGHRDAVVVHPSSPEETAEARAFEDAFLARGGVVTRRLPYTPGTTTFGAELEEAGSLAPRLLVVAAPSADVELLAPQIAFYGLDTLGIQVAGTGGWTAASVLESVDPRHTNRVLAVATMLPGTVDDPVAEFGDAYEEHFRRTLRSPVPAVGFDLFRMVLVAYAEGHRGSHDLADAMDRLQGYEGATGTYSFVEGRLRREHFTVRIYDRRLHLLDADAAVPSGDAAAGRQEIVESPSSTESLRRP